MTPIRGSCFLLVLLAVGCGKASLVVDSRFQASWQTWVAGVRLHSLI